MQEQSERLYKVKRLVFEFIYFKSKAFDSIGRKRKNQVGEKFLGLIYQFPVSQLSWPLSLSQPQQQHTWIRLLRCPCFTSSSSS